MKKLIAAAALAVAAMLAPTAASAEGVYFTGGYTQFDADNLDVGAVTVRGGWRFHPNFAGEVEGSFGVDDDNGVELDNSFAVFGVGVLPVTPDFDVFARLGYHTSEFSPGDSQDGVAGGVGAQWNINQRFGVRGDVTVFDGDDDEATAYSLALVVKVN